jgi:metallo-beta-lactamase class B
MYVTPGHTMGTISPVFDVRSGGKSHRAMLWGGTAFNFGKDLPRLDSYINATQRMMGVADQQKVDVMLSNHASYDATVTKLDQMRKQSGTEPNPFVIGVPNVKRSLTVMCECAEATRDPFSL